MGPQAQDAWSHQELEEAGTNPPLEISEGAQPCEHLDFGLLATNSVRELFLLFSAPSSWCLLR